MYREFLARLIAEETDRAEDAILAAHARGDAVIVPQWGGVTAGCEACLECASAPEIGQLLVFARANHVEVLAAPLPDLDACVFAEYFKREITWICECVSALLLNEGMDAMIRPGSRAVLKCAELLGVAPGGVPIAPLRFLDSPATGTPECLCSFCGQPIAVSEFITLRAWDARGLELRACGDAACVRAFLAGVHDDATMMARAGSGDRGV
jgi:hypothetical protein